MLNSDAQIATLLKANKSVYGTHNPRTVTKSTHKERNYTLIDSSKNIYQLYVRQSNRNPSDFSAGLSILDEKGMHHTLTRYNGSSHDHPNTIEGTRTGYNCHIHTSTERYIKAKLKPEGYAENTQRYHSIDGALHCIVVDCNISGIATVADQPLLFRLP